jgi:hypothetical protein
VYGQVGQDATVQADSSTTQACDEAAVAQTIGAGSRVDTGDPQRSELALALTAVAVGVLACLDDRLLGDAVHAAACAVVTLGAIEDFFVTASGGDATLDTGHV